MTRREDFEDLEGELDDMGSKYLRAKARLRKTDERVAALTAQRDATLEACEALVHSVVEYTVQVQLSGRFADMGDLNAAVHDANLAIAKAKEVTP